MRIDIYVATEDALSEAVADRLIEEENQGMCVAVRMRGSGNTYLREKLSSYAAVANTLPFLLLTDLDRGTCPAGLIDEWRGKRRLPPRMLLRVVVREIEAWLLADREGFADFSGVPLDRITERPESLNDPKETLLNLVRRYGKRTVKEDILPRRNSTARIGLAYNQALCEFARGLWSPARAADVADSLSRARRRLHELRLSQQDNHEVSS